MKKTMIFVILISLILGGCNILKSEEVDEVADSVAATVIAKAIEETVIASTNQQPTAEPTEMPTDAPTNTAIPTNTTAPANTPIPTATTGITCNVATFISDVTVPDGTIFLPLEPFIKTWRLKNMGSCAWTTSYKLVFSHGDRMNAAGEVLLPITVPPGQSVDISINLVAPDAEGHYRGDFKLMDPNGNLFALSNGATFYVDIESRAVAVLGPPPVDPMMPAGGFELFPPVNVITASSNGVSANGVFIVGDYDLNFGYNAFISFDLSNIPDGAIISNAVMELPAFDVEGNPFTDLGCIRFYIGDYFPVTEVDVSFPNTGATARVCSLVEAMSFDVNVNHIISFLGTGMDVIEFQAVFNNQQSDFDFADDFIHAGNRIYDTRLIIEYTP